MMPSPYLQMAALSHRIESRAVELAGTPGVDATQELTALADGDAVATALALSYAFRQSDRHPEDPRYPVAARLLARVLDRIRATTAD